MMDDFRIFLTHNNKKAVAADQNLNYPNNYQKFFFSESIENKL